MLYAFADMYGRLGSALGIFILVLLCRNLFISKRHSFANRSVAKFANRQHAETYSDADKQELDLLMLNNVLQHYNLYVPCHIILPSIGHLYPQSQENFQTFSKQKPHILIKYE